MKLNKVQQLLVTGMAKDMVNRLVAGQATQADLDLLANPEVAEAVDTEMNARGLA